MGGPSATQSPVRNDQSCNSEDSSHNALKETNESRSFRRNQHWRMIYLQLWRNISVHIDIFSSGLSQSVPWPSPKTERRKLANCEWWRHAALSWPSFFPPTLCNSFAAQHSWRHPHEGSFLFRSMEEDARMWNPTCAWITHHPNGSGIIYAPEGAHARLR